MLRSAVLLLLTLAGCPSAAEPPAPDKAAMSDSFAKAFAGFRDHAAQHFGVSVDQVIVVQSDEAGANGWNIPVGQAWLPLKTGRAWAFESVKVGAPGPALRGYALPDGTVATTKQHLGRLLAEAGVWQPAPDLVALGRRLVWTLGMAWSLAEDRPPVLELAADGSGKLSIFARLRPPGPGTMQKLHALDIALMADHAAVLTLSENLNP